MGCKIFIFVCLIISAYLFIQFFRYRRAVTDSKERLRKYNANTAWLSYGKMAYIDRGNGETVLYVHGIFGGYDQAYESAGLFKDEYRIIAPSRFGYLGSDVYGDGSPQYQAKAYIELLDMLGIDSAFVLAASAGGTAVFRLALDYPERIKGLIFYSAAMPYKTKPVKYAEYAGPPAFVCNDYLMFVFKPLFKLLLGMDNKTVNEMLPLRERKEGAILDSKLTNVDMARNFGKYCVEDLKVPSLVFQPEDDRLSDYDKAVAGASRLPECTFVSFKNGGHLLEGHDNEIRAAVCEFCKK